MAIVLLVRHAAHDLLGRAIAGRMPGVHLNGEGRRQASLLAEQLARAPIAAVYSSPLERARETAQPIAERLKLPLRIAGEANEVDFGDWTNRDFAALAKLEAWRLFHSFRSGTRIPGGELLIETQARIVGLIGRLAERHGREHIAVVSHGDVIRSALVYYLGMPIDFISRIEVGPASISTLIIDEDGSRLLQLNQWSEPRPPEA